MSEKGAHKNGKRISLAILIISAIVFGFIAGLGGSLILSLSLIQQPLQRQHEENMRLNIDLQNRLATTIKQVARHDADILKLQEKINYILVEDSSSYISSLYKMQKDYEAKETEMIRRLAQLESRLDELNGAYKEFSRSVDAAKNDLDAMDNSLTGQLREVKSSFNDLENKFRRLEQRDNFK